MGIRSVKDTPPSLRTFYAPGTKAGEEAKKREAKKTIGTETAQALRTDHSSDPDEVTTHELWGRCFYNTPGAQGAHQIGAADSATVRFAESKVEVHPSWSETALSDAMSTAGDFATLDLNKVDAQTFLGLEPSQRQLFMAMLQRLELPVERRDGDDKPQTLGDKKITKGFNRLSMQVFGMAPVKTSTENAAEAFARKIWASGDSKAFATVFAANPQAVMPMVEGDAAAVLCLGQLQRVLTQLRLNGAQGGNLDARELNALGDLFCRYLEVNTGGKRDKVDATVQQLMSAVDYDRLLDSGPKTAGMVTGAMLAGMKKFVDQHTKEHDQKKATVNTIANNIWASSGWAAFVGGLGAGVAGVAIAQTVVGAATWYQNQDPEVASDEFVNRARGEMEVALLQGVEAMNNGSENGTKLPESWADHDGGYAGAVRMMNDWLTATLHSNGAG